MIADELKEIGLEIENLSACIDLILERVNKTIDNSNYLRPEFKERLKFNIYKAVHYEN